MLRVSYGGGAFDDITPSCAVWQRLMRKERLFSGICRETGGISKRFSGG